MKKLITENYKKVLEIFSKDEVPSIQRVDEIMETARTFLPTITFSGTSSVSTIFGSVKQREDVFSRDVIMEKTGFRTKTDKKYVQGAYYSKPVNPNLYSQICITGTTQLWEEYIL